MNSSYTTSLCQMKSLSGTHRVKILSHSLTDVFSYEESFQCSTFTVGEYQWAILYYPNGINKYTYSSRGKYIEPYISFYLQLLSEAKDVRVKLRFSLVDQSGLASPDMTQSLLFTFRNKEDKKGMNCFGTRSSLVSFLKDDSFTVECNLQIINPTVVEEEGKKNGAISVPPSNMREHLHRLLQSGEGADISFKVKGETFSAHRDILAARSSVFRAELFGCMKERNAGCIQIEDMEPEVFKALLQFIYTDDIYDEGADEDIMAQHLIVAADRYDLARLRLLCEEKLAERIGSDNAVTMLALAARHNCQQLKEICLNYISSSEILRNFTETDVFASLMASCPSIYKELLQKVDGNRRT